VGTGEKEPLPGRALSAEAQRPSTLGLPKKLHAGVENARWKLGRQGWVLGCTEPHEGEPDNLCNIF
jgi:hypothetical protein